MYYMMQINYINIINVKIDISLEITYINIYKQSKILKITSTTVTYSLPSMFITSLQMLVILCMLCWYIVLLTLTVFPCDQRTD